MLEKFPELKGDEVALSRADCNTGIVLDEKFEYPLTPSQKIYTVFNNVDEALKFANEILRVKMHIEIYIHKNDKNLLHFFNYKSFR